MNSEIRNVEFRQFVIKAVLFYALTIGLIVFINYFVDASQVITSRMSEGMARLALKGNIVKVPKNYNERTYQIAVVEQMHEIPDTIVIGSSRGMFLGSEITGYKRIYNHCVSGACIEDYYAILGLYEQKFSKLPKRIVMEVSPWVFNEYNPESRWLENYKYLSNCERFYKEINHRKLEKKNTEKENPYISLPYFQYNILTIQEKGWKAFSVEPASVSNDKAERAELPDGTIRYDAKMANPNAERLKKVKETRKGVSYERSDKMKKLGKIQQVEFENLLRYLHAKNTEVVFYLQPFSVTQCKYIYDKNTNPVFKDVETYLVKTGKSSNIKVVGGYNARKFGLTDKLFIDFMHLDKEGTKITWDY